MCKFRMFNKNVLCHGHDAIHFDVNNQAFFTYSYLNEEFKTNYFIVIDYASHHFNIDKVYKFVIIQTKEADVT